LELFSGVEGEGAWRPPPQPEELLAGMLAAGPNKCSNARSRCTYVNAVGSPCQFHGLPVCHIGPRNCSEDDGLKAAHRLVHARWQREAAAADFSRGLSDRDFCIVPNGVSQRGFESHRCRDMADKAFL